MISAVDVTKDYRTEGRVHRVLSGISFTVAKGEKLAVLGRNGAGKSTLIRLIGGVELPNSRHHRTNHECVVADRIGRRLSSVFDRK